MNNLWPPEELDLLLSCYLDGELDLATRIELDGWLGAYPEGRERLNRLKAVIASLADLHLQAEVPAGWTVKAYRIGLPKNQPASKRMMFLGLGQAMARPKALGHGQGVHKACRRWKTRLPKKVMRSR
jgi:anti-sigma factor RsiW